MADLFSFNRNSNRLSITFQLLIVFTTLLRYSNCLYEDQVGKFDWKQNYVGKLKFAHFDTVSNTKKIIVATEENVIAAINLKSGQILWRRVLEKGESGNILAVGGIQDGELVTVNGGVPAIVRAWDLATGNIIHEWPIAELNHGRIKDVKWYIKDGVLHHILPTYNNGVEVTSYDAKTGDKLNSRRISAPFITEETQCVLAAPYLTCLEGDANLMLFQLHLFESNSQPQWLTINTIFGAGAQGPYKLSAVNGDYNVVGVSADGGQRKRLLLVEEVAVPISRDIDGNANLYTVNIDNEKVLLEATYNKGVTEILATELSTSNPLPAISMNVSHNALFHPVIMASTCLKQSKGITCRHLLSSEDHSIAMVGSNKLIWSREEALARIIAVEIVELPMSDRDREIETEFDQKERNVLSMMLRRINSQLKQARTFLQSMIINFKQQPSDQRMDLVRDKFGLHKMIVLVTAAGKLYGIETRKGEIIWQLRVPGIRGFSEKEDGIVLYVQRGSRHFPYPPQCALLAEDKDTGNGIVYTFNPITGQPLDGFVSLSYRIKQSMLLHVPIEDFLRGIIILDTRDKVHIYPERAKAVAARLAKNIYIFTVDKNSGVFSGYSLSYSTAEELIAHKVWELLLSPRNQRITRVASKNPIERVHSQGRVLGDRSVLYKYINPNLIAIVTEGVGHAQKNTINLYLLDVVSGAMIFSIAHKRARGPVHTVHSENWIVYSYFNEKSRRTEIASLELYEGKVQSNTTVFSSLATAKLPIVERQAFIFPASIESMRETITEKGITSKHIIVALANGGVLELPWMMVDPRRPVNPESREEGVIPYTPEIPIHMDATINYNQSVFRVAGVHTSPSGLESTCLVFVHGLDLFYTRVAPSKTFDVLKEDFDYYLIVVVLAALVISSYIAKKLASQKAQKQAWK